MKVTVKRWGTKLAIRLPDEVVRDAKLTDEQQVRMSVVDGRVIIDTKPEATILEFGSFAVKKQK